MVFIGNKKAASFLSRSLETGSFSQAYLFSGPEGVGKLTMAKLFAEGIINGREFFIGEDISGGHNLDLLIIAPEIEEKGGKKREKDIPIELVREAQKEIALFPYKGKRKVLIIDNAHKMGTASQNALLKVLEEPNSTSVIILVTHEDSKILPTIKSRCQKVIFSLAGREDMELLAGSLEKGIFIKYEAISMGRPGIFKKLLENDEGISDFEGACEDFEKIMHGEINQRLAYAEKIARDSLQAVRILNVWTWMLRNNIFKEKSVEKVENIYGSIEKIEKAISEIKSTNANVRLLLENLMIAI